MPRLLQGLRPGRTVAPNCATVILSAAVLLAGCGGGTAKSAAPAANPVAGRTSAADPADGGSSGDCAGLPPAQASTRLCAKVQLSGAVTLSGVVASDTFSNLSVAPPDNCAQYGATGGSTKNGGEAGFPLPSLGPSTGNGVISGHKLSLDTGGIAHYHGPGNYQLVDLARQIDMKVDDRTYAANSDSSVTVTVKADGAGSITFTQLHDLQSNDAPSLDGTVTWTCSNH